MRVAAYARYSSDKQSESSIDDQLRRVREYASKAGLELDPALIFADAAISGASTQRPGFESLMARIARREIDVLLVEDTSRLSRDNADALNLFKQLAFRGVKLISISDGIDSSTKGAKLAFSVKALMSDLYLEDLRDKTLRGMEGRAHAGLATGGRTLGYRTVPVVEGRRVEIDPEGAQVVRRIFADYVGGGNCTSIAKAFNAEGVPSPRDKTKHDRKSGWGALTIRSILMNERYTGAVVFNRQRWVKVPGTNKRIPQERPSSEWIRREAPELRIIDAETWARAQAKLAETRALFTRGDDGKRKGKAPRCANLSHPLSGLLRCACGAPMVLDGGGPGRRYYRCALNRVDRCAEPRAPLLASVARERILSDLRLAITSSDALARIRRRITQNIADALKGRGAALAERRARLTRTEGRIANLVDAFANGERSPALSHALHDMEAQAVEERRQIVALERVARAPVALPDPAAILKRAVELEQRIAENPAGAREELHALFKDKALTLELGADGIYTARSELLPLVILAPEKTTAPPVSQEGCYPALVAGAGFDSQITIPFASRLAA